MDKIKILIIEDHEILAKTLASFLLELLPGSVVSFAVDKKTAFDFLKKENFNLITLDGRLLNNDHGSHIIEEMNDKQVEKTIVCSFEINFLIDCHKKQIDYVNKSGDLLEEFEKILKKKKIL